MIAELVADLLPSLPAPYEPQPSQAERRCERCLVDLMKHRHEADCPKRPQLDDVLRLATTPAERRIEDALVVAHRRAVRAWLKTGRTF